MIRSFCSRIVCCIAVAFFVMVELSPSLRAAPPYQEVIHDITVTVPSLALLRIEFPSVLIDFDVPIEPVPEGIFGDVETTFSFFTNELNKKIVANLLEPLNDPYISLEACFFVDGEGQGQAQSVGWQQLSTSPVTLVDSISQAHYRHNTLQYRLHIGLESSVDQGAIPIHIELVDR